MKTNVILDLLTTLGFSWLVHHFTVDCNISTTVAWISMAFCKNIYDLRRITEVGDRLTFLF